MFQDIMGYFGILQEVYPSIENGGETQNRHFSIEELNDQSLTHHP
jgi:hypothetical protein